MKVSEIINKINAVKTVIREIREIETHTEDSPESASLLDAAHYLDEYVAVLMNREVEK